jgi:hypothetical protein
VRISPYPSPMPISRFIFISISLVDCAGVHRVIIKYSLRPAYIDNKQDEFTLLDVSEILISCK